jgi:hypothetical protein
VSIDIAIGWIVILAIVVIAAALILAGSHLARPEAPEPTCGSTADPWPIVCRPVMPEDLDR